MKLHNDEGRKELGFTSLSTAYVISRRDRNQEPGRNSLLFTNSSKRVFQLHKDHRQSSTTPHSDNNLT